VIHQVFEFLPFPDGGFGNVIILDQRLLDRATDPFSSCLVSDTGGVVRA